MCIYMKKQSYKNTKLLEITQQMPECFNNCNASLNC